MITSGRITDWDGQRWIGVEVADDIYDMLANKQSAEVIVDIPDGRKISAKQRRKIFVLVHSIADFAYGVRNDRDYTECLRQLKLLYITSLADDEAVRRMLTVRFCELSDIDLFSLSNVDMTTARHFIDWLVEMCVNYEIPCQDTLLNLCEDIGKYLYNCVAKRRCCICGKKADIHEVETVGMGRDRRKIHHLNQEVQPLCRQHHNEVGDLGQKTFNAKYHLQTIKLDKTLCKKLKWRV